MKNANKAIVYVATSMPAVVDGFVAHGNPAIRRAGERMRDVRAMPDQETGRRHQAAEDALFSLPMPQIELCIALFLERCN